MSSSQDKVLSWNYGNKHFGCKKEDGVSSYIKAMGINEIEIVKVIEKNGKKSNNIVKYDFGKCYKIAFIYMF